MVDMGWAVPAVVALGLALWSWRLAVLGRRLDRRRAELHDERGRMWPLLQAVQDAVVLIDAGGLVRRFNPAAERMFGYRAEEMVGQPVGRLMPDAFAAGHDAFLARPHAGDFHRMGPDRDIVGRRRDGSEFPVEIDVAAYSEDGCLLHVGLVRDAGQRKDRDTRLSRLATTDALTGLLNRRAFLEAGEAMMAGRGYKPLTMLMLDADRFKSVNDAHGHAAGDELLKCLARIVADSARGDDAVGRLGGEEFAVLLNNTGVEGGTNLAERMLASIRAAQVDLPGDHRIGFTVSIGISSTATAHDLSALLHQADQALSVAKASGRDRLVAVTDETLRTLSPPG
jgi:diguanylate cyclase (GGDEF)-like protein/PAS domain S-box-containing protein